LDFVQMRWRFSAVTSFASFVLALWLALTPGIPVDRGTAFMCAVIFAVDAVVKWCDLRGLRRYTSLLYSLANAVLIFSGFLFAGEPWSYIFAYLWVLDAVLKVPGVDVKWEGQFRHLFSAANTALLGLVFIFGVRVFSSALLSVVLGWLVLVDAYVKWKYLRGRHFVM